MFKRAMRILTRLWRTGPAVAHALYQGWRNPPTYPVAIHVEHIVQCNLKCIMCVHGTSGFEKAPNMTMDKFREIIGQFKGPNAPPEFGGLQFILLQGIGEPMLHPDTIPMIGHAHDRGLFTATISNMTILSDQAAEGLVRSGLDSLIVSIDSVDPAIFAEIRRGAPFDILPRVLENLEKLNQTKERLGSQTPEIEAASLLMKRTLPRVAELVCRMKALGVRKILFNDVTTSGISEEMCFADGTRGVDETLLTLPKEERMRIMQEIKGLDSKECRVQVPEDWGGVSQAKREDGVLTCDDLWDKPYITVEGVVTPCCYAPFKSQLPMGDLAKQSFKDIWFGEPYQRLRRQHLTARPPAVCFVCRERVKMVARSTLTGRLDGSAAGPRGGVFLGSRPCSFRRAPDSTP